MDPELLRLHLLAKIDDLLSRWVVAASDKRVLRALRKYLQSVKRSELETIASYLEATMSKDKLLVEFEKAIPKGAAVDWKALFEQLWQLGGPVLMRIIIELLTKLAPSPVPPLIGDAGDHNHLECLKAALSSSCLTCKLLAHAVEHESNK